MALVDSVKRARNKGVPILAVRTTDPAATMAAVTAAVNGTAPALRWDIVNGIVGLNEAGQSAVGDRDTGNPTEAMIAAASLPPTSLLFVCNAHRCLDPGNPNTLPVAQAIWNLRDRFKADGRTLVLLGPDFTFPAELEQDIIVFDEPLPGDEALARIVTEQFTAAGLDQPDEKKLGQVVDAVRGLAAFPAEQVIAMSLTKAGVNMNMLRRQTNLAIEQTRGLTVDKDSVTFTDIGGLDEAKQVGFGLGNGPAAPKLIVRIEEIEKALSGAAGPAADTSGTSQDILDVLLTGMEDNDWYGFILYGVPGSGKSFYSKALGNTLEVRSVRADLNAAKDKWVGGTEANIRAIMRRIRAIAGVGGACFLASANRLKTIPPELKRRFRYGIYMFDLPTAEERGPIWTINLRRFGFDPTKAQRPNDEGWTGADIRNVCEIAWRFGSSLTEAAARIVPVSKSDPESIEEMRQIANGRFLSASYPGPYRKPSGVVPAARKIEVE